MSNEITIQEAESLAGKSKSAESFISLAKSQFAGRFGRDIITKKLSKCDDGTLSLVIQHSKYGDVFTKSLFLSLNPRASLKKFINVVRAYAAVPRSTAKGLSEFEYGQRTIDIEIRIKKATAESLKQEAALV